MLSWSLDTPHATAAGAKSMITPIKQLVRSVSRLLRVVVRLVNDDWTSAVDDVIGLHGDVTKRSPPPAAGDDGRQLRAALMKVDNTNCATRCFTTARSAALFVSAALNKGWSISGFIISSVAGKLLWSHFFGADALSMCEYYRLYAS